jgi:hypothetical protein
MKENDMVTFVIPKRIFRRCRRDLLERPEAVGFFAADYKQRTHTFRARQWRPIPLTGLEDPTAPHIVLRDRVAAEIIKWAWDENVSLIEAHSHGSGSAAFSLTDLMGLEEWVPHLSWRLNGRPYGALVVAGDTVDALAWVDDALTPQQVKRLRVGLATLRPTGLTRANLETTRGHDG